MPDSGTGRAYRCRAARRRWSVSVLTPSGRWLIPSVSSSVLKGVDIRRPVPELLPDDTLLAGRPPGTHRSHWRSCASSSGRRLGVALTARRIADAERIPVGTAASRIRAAMAQPHAILPTPRADDE